MSSAKRIKGIVKDSLFREKSFTKADYRKILKSVLAHLEEAERNSSKIKQLLDL